MKILILDNYDSFTYNLFQLVKQHEKVKRVDVIRNDQITLDQIKQYDKILLSPGPSLPKDAGLMNEIIKTYASTKPMLGICLGHQAIAEVFGAELFNLASPDHGIVKQTHVVKSSDYLFEGIPQHFQSCRYHSWAVDSFSLPTTLEVIADDNDGIIMGIAHRQFDVRGLQFHPESIASEHGKQLFNNWINH